MPQSPTYDQLPPHGGKIITKDNEVIDAQDFLQSGSIVVTSVESETPVVPLGDATQPRYEQMPVNVYKIVNQNNEVIDVIELLESGAIKVQITGTHGDAPVTGSYITKIDETSVLTNSIPLSGLPTGFLASETISGDLITRTFSGTANQVSVLNGDGSADTILGLPTDLRLPGTLKLGGDLDASVGTIKGVSATVDLFSSIGVNINAPQTRVVSLAYIDLITNRINFSPVAQTFLIESIQRMRITSAGFQLSTGSIVNKILDEDDMVSNSDTALSTQKSIKSFGTQSYGNLIFESGDWIGTTYSFTQSFVEITGTITFSENGSSSDMNQVSNGRLQYTGLSTKKFIAFASLSLDKEEKIAIRLMVNGVEAGNAFYTSSDHCIIVGTNITLSTNDYVSLSTKSAFPGIVEITSASFSVVSITGQ